MGLNHQYPPSPQYKFNFSNSETNHNTLKKRILGVGGLSEEHQYTLQLQPSLFHKSLKLKALHTQHKRSYRTSTPSNIFRNNDISIPHFQCGAG